MPFRSLDHEEIPYDAFDGLFVASFRVLGESRTLVHREGEFGVRTTHQEVEHPKNGAVVPLFGSRFSPFVFREDGAAAAGDLAPRLFPSLVSS